MRRTAVMLLALGATALAATGCGKKEEPVMPSTAPLETASSAAPTLELTHAQHEIVEHLPAPYNTADPANGQAQFAQCRACHTIEKGGPNLTGPNLYGAFGHKAAQVPGFDFSNGLKSAGLVLDAPTLDKWINDPRDLVPDTKMTFNGVKDAKNRADIIAYIATQQDTK
jgi:cytochrome c